LQHLAIITFNSEVKNALKYDKPPLPHTFSCHDN
jgi:hypothetical protein